MTDAAAAAAYANGRFTVYVPGYSPPDFVQPWQGVFVLASGPSSATLQGTAYSTGVPVPLHPGWNLVAAPYPSSGMSTSTIKGEAGACNVQEIATYTSGSGYSVWLPGQPGRTIPSTSGMWVLCTGSSTWTPS